MFNGLTKKRTFQMSKVRYRTPIKGLGGICIAGPTVPDASWAGSKALSRSPISGANN